jgi:DNA repair protein RadC
MTRDVSLEETFSLTEKSTREISKMALLHGAASIILVHNHPSGDPTPSKEDIEITNRIIQALLPIKHLFLKKF